MPNLYPFGDLDLRKSQLAALAFDSEFTLAARSPVAGFAPESFVFPAGLGSSKATLGGRSVTPSNDSEAPTLPLKPCTLAGMASKTTSTIVPKRVAHVPSLQVRGI